LTATERLIIALDTPDSARALELVSRLRGRVGAFKLGLEFLHAAGPEGVRAVREAGADRLFLDVKLCDIPNTVAGAVRSLGRLNPWMLNVHATAGKPAMEAALVAAGEAAVEAGTPRPLVIAVTILTSLDAGHLRTIGVSAEPREAVLRLAVLAREAGLDGVVASPEEAEAIREACGGEFLIVTPGIRPAGADRQDQARIATPAEAIRRGADFLVIGRPITGAADPAEAAARIVAEIGEAEGTGADAHAG
jgi:orotidine-5'-phosphate decarboxylase